jgi:enoyl-[acyl-carrier-protein] reductase (NADH)
MTWLVNDNEYLHAGGAAYQPVPNFGHMTIANGALLKLVQVISAEHKDKPVRINEVCPY